MATTEQLPAGKNPERIFWPRVSEVVGELAEVLQQAPERPLSDSEKQDVMDFEQALFNGSFNDEKCPTPLLELPNVEDNSVQLVPEFFTTEAGRQSLKEQLGIELPDTDDVAVIKQELLKLPFSLLQQKENTDRLRALQGQALDSLKAKYADMAQRTTDARDIETITLVKDPNKTLRYARVLHQNKAFIRRVRTELRRLPDENINAAKLTVTDIYRDKINARLASSYPTLMALYRQYEAIGEDVASEAPEELKSALKAAKTAENSPDIRQQFVRMLDYVRNGAAYDSDGKLTPLDENIFADVEALNQVPKSTGEAVFSAEETELFKQYAFDSLEMKSFLDAYLERTGLSAEGWTTEIRDGIRSFAVSGIKKIIKIPGKFKSEVAREFPSTGVVGLTEHEVGGINPGHVIQSVNTSYNPYLLEIARSPKFRGKRYLALREAGGVLAEAEAMKHYFGQSRRYNASYAEAMKTLLAGGTHADAVRSFAQSMLNGRENSEQDVTAVYITAADRVMRLLRSGGRDSQALNYVEAATVRKVAGQLPEVVVDSMFAEAVYDPIDMIRLHRFGLLDTSSEHRFKSTEDSRAIIAQLLKERLASVNKG